MNIKGQTTIMVKSSTKRRLDQLKYEIEAGSYNEVISYLLDRTNGTPESMFRARRNRGDHEDI